MINLYEKISCKKCKTPTEKIDLFPKDMCIQCYKQTSESKKEYTKDLFIKTLIK